MKQKTFLVMLTFFTLLLTACQEKATKKSSSSSNPYNLNCTGQAYWTTPGCTGYCQYNPSSYGCGSNVGGTNSGTTTGTTTGGTTTGTTTGGTSCATNPFSYACYCQTYPQGTGCSGTGVGAVNPYWGMMYPPTNTPPDDSVSTCTSYNPSGVTSAYETRKGTVTVIGGQWYNPASGASSLYNTSSTLKSVSAAKNFFITDSMLKVRFKVRPQPHSANTSNTCYGRTVNQSYIAGYWKLKFNATLVGTRADNTTGEEPLGIIEGNVNSCTPAIDLSPYVGMYPNGVYIRLTDVQSNQGTWPADYSTNGFKNGATWKTVRTSDCWTLDIEVAADGTKTFD